jgi:hypothetical protein
MARCGDHWKEHEHKAPIPRGMTTSRKEGRNREFHLEARRV